MISQDRTLFDDLTPSQPTRKLTEVFTKLTTEPSRNFIYTSIDLFSGCGGLTKGFELAGIKSIFASDIDENCEKTFTRNFPQTPFLCKDITDLQEILDAKADSINAASKEEFDAAIKMLCDDLYSYVDNQEQMMSYYFNQHIMGKMTDTLEYIERIKAVKRENVIDAAQKLRLDTIYFLKGEEECDE